MARTTLPQPPKLVGTNRDQGPFPNLRGETLPAAGAYTDQGYTPIPALARRMSVVMKYTGGAGSTGGKPRFALQWEVPGRSDVYEVAIDGESVTTSAPFSLVPEYAVRIDGLTAAAGTSIAWRAMTVDVPSGAVAARLLVAESGDTAHPGAVDVDFFTSDVN